MIIDWHNYGYTLMALALGKDHTFVKIAKRYEALPLIRMCLHTHACNIETFNNIVHANSMNAIGPAIQSQLYGC